MTEEKTLTFDIPKECKAGVVVNEGPDFRVEVQMVPVPEISVFPSYLTHSGTFSNGALDRAK